MTTLFGVLAFAVGSILTVAAVARPINVGNTVNLGLMCDRICLLIGAGTFWIMGAVLASASMISSSVADRRYHD